MPKQANILNEKYHRIIVVLLLTSAVVALYWPVADYEFIALDDNFYIVENSGVQKGFTLKSLAWALTTFHTTNWHPLTWLSYMVDYQLFGLSPAGYHIHNLILHLVNTLLLFYLLRRMTGQIWKSGVVAAFFAVHPLNIESLVWIAERKNLLSTLFFILTIMAYLQYTENPGWRRYSLILVCFALGLMAKPMLVVLPFVLLLIDYWPLQRFYLPDQTQSGAIQDRAEQRKLLTRILVDKVPMIIMSMFSSWVTLKAASSGGAVKATSIFPLIGRIENAIISYAMYLYKMVWPTDLAIFYPYPIGRPVWHVTLSIFFLTAITIFICLKGRKYRYLITGWFWYLITLLPVIGLVQVGFQSMANRYAYIPLIGIFIVIVWGLSDFLKRFSGRQYTEAVAFAMILALAFCTKSTLPDWKNSERVFMQALNVTKNNHIAEMGMGNVWLGRGDLIKAGSHYLGALLLKPDYAEAHNNLGLVLLRLGKVDEAAAQYREALKDNPDYAEAYNNLGAVLAGQGKWKEAEESFRRSLKSKPHYTGARSNLAKLFLQQGKIEESIKHFHAALEVEPDNAELKKNLEDALHQILTQKKSRSEVR